MSLKKNQPIFYCTFSKNAGSYFTAFTLYLTFCFQDFPEPVVPRNHLIFKHAAEFNCIWKFVQAVQWKLIKMKVETQKVMVSWLDGLHSTSVTILE